MPITQEQLNPELRDMEPWERSKYLADLRREAQLKAMAELEKTVGAPKQATLGREFTMPDMTRRTFSEAGDLRSIELSPNFANEYSPPDQKRLEKLYATRSEIATDPEITEQERQDAFDKVDAAISKVPRVSPMMKEPTAQQKFDAAIVTAPDGSKGTFDTKTGKFIPLESAKAQQEMNTELRKRRAKIYDDLVKANAKAIEEGEPERTSESMSEEADMQSKIEFGIIKPAGSAIPKLDPVWQMFKGDLDDKLSSKGRASEKQMIDMMSRYSFYATNMRELEGLSEAEVKYDFMQRWQQALGDGDPVVAKMSQQTKRRMWIVASDANDPKGTVRNSIDVIDGLRRGEGRVTVDDKTISTLSAKPAPPGMEAVWPNIDDEIKTDIQRLMMEGKSVPQILAKLKELGMI